MFSYQSGRLCVALSVLALVLVPHARAEDAKPADVAGTWKWTTPGRNGGEPRDVAMKLKQEGEKVTGTISGWRADSETAIEEGKIKGNELTFTVTREANGNKFVQKYSGKIDGGALKGTIVLPARQGGEPRTREWEAKREKAAASAAGEWKWSVTRDDGASMESVLKLKQDGEKLTGVNVFNNGPEVAIENGKVVGDAVSFSITHERDGNKVVSKYAGKLEDGKLVGQATINWGDEDRTFDITYDRVK